PQPCSASKINPVSSRSARRRRGRRLKTDKWISLHSKSSTTGTPPFKRTVGEPRSALSVRTVDNPL
ncbi:hypothetical protein RB213_006330, partial [Colletotrichum asianum]